MLRKSVYTLQVPKGLQSAHPPLVDSHLGYVLQYLPQSEDIIKILIGEKKWGIDVIYSIIFQLKKAS